MNYMAVEYVNEEPSDLHSVPNIVRVQTFLWV
jgi:hypothetical protein